LKSEIGCGGAVLLTPLVEQAPIAERNVIRGADAEARGSAVNPFGRPFELGIIAYGCFVDYAMALAILPLGAPFFVVEGGDQAEREKDFGEDFAVGDFGFGFDAMLVAIFAGSGIGQAFVGHGPAAGIAADAEDFSASAHSAIRGVVENVALEASWCEQRESRGLEPTG